MYLNRSGKKLQTWARASVHPYAIALCHAYWNEVSYMMRLSRLFLAMALCLAAIAAPAQKKPSTLVIISIDGMKPEYATHADEHGLKVPELRSFLKEGTYAEGVIGVVPTVTYPSHTTLVTGVWPVQHGVYSNLTFDPLGQHPGEWYCYSRY